MGVAHTSGKQSTSWEFQLHAELVRSDQTQCLCPGSPSLGRLDALALRVPGASCNAEMSADAAAHSCLGDLTTIVQTNNFL